MPLVTSTEMFKKLTKATMLLVPSTSTTWKSSKVSLLQLNRKNPR